MSYMTEDTSNTAERVATRSERSDAVEHALARADKVAQRHQQSAAQSAQSARLGNTETIDKQQVRGLWALQATAWQVTSLTRVRGCHRWRSPGASTVAIEWAGNGESRFSQLQDSHSIWASPISACKLAGLRAGEITRAVDNWLEQGKQSGNTYGVEFITLTVRHDRTQALRDVWDVVAKAWASAVGGASWHGGVRTSGDKNRFGVEHWIRSVEVTHSRKNGWHVHVHALLLTRWRLSDDERNTLAMRMFERWQKRCLRMGFKSPDEKHGVHIEAAVTEQNTAKLGAYMAKGQTSKLAMELASGQASKQASKQASRTPFQILGDIRRAIEAGEDYSSDLRIYHEWEESSSGRRAQGWSKDAKKSLGILELSDEELTEKAEEENSDRWVVARIPSEQWSIPVPGRDRKLSDDTELRLEITERIKKARTEKSAQKVAEKMLTKLGIYFESVLIPVRVEKTSRETQKMKSKYEASQFGDLLAAQQSSKQASQGVLFKSA